MEERRTLPNGRRTEDQYNAEWCRDKHEQLDKRLDNFNHRFERVESLLVRIMLALFGNLFGLAILCLTMWLKAEGNL